MSQKSTYEMDMLPFPPRARPKTKQWLMKKPGHKKMMPRASGPPQWQCALHPSYVSRRPPTEAREDGWTTILDTASALGTKGKKKDRFCKSRRMKAGDGTPQVLHIFWTGGFKKKCTYTIDTSYQPVVSAKSSIKAEHLWRKLYTSPV